MTLLTAIRDLWFGTASGNAAPPAAQSPCYASVTLVGGLQGIAPRERHWFAGDPVCRRCGADNPYRRAPEQPETPEVEPPSALVQFVTEPVTARPERVLSALEGLSAEEFDGLRQSGRAGGAA